jgi:1-deoxy-D-xylulose-5-phosphate reductoisomerase
LNKEIKYLDIAELIKGAMDKHKVIENPSLNEILEAEKEAHEVVRSLSERFC